MEENTKTAQEVLDELKEDINARIKGLDDIMLKRPVTATEFMQISAAKGELERVVDAYPELRIIKVI